MLFERAADTFVERSPSGIGCLDARGVVVTDLDGDGDQDIAIANKDGPLSIYESEGRPSTRDWLRVTLQGRTSNRDGNGATVVVHTARGRRIRPVGAGGVVHSTSPAEAWFGLGDDRVDALDVYWPSGRRSRVPGPLAGAIVIDEDGAQ